VHMREYGKRERTRRPARRPVTGDGAAAGGAGLAVGVEAHKGAVAGVQSRRTRYEPVIHTCEPVADVFMRHICTGAARVEKRHF
jgi:hypothetical protein